MKQKIKSYVKNQLFNARRKNYIKYYKKIIQQNTDLGKPAEGEKVWMEKWRQYDKKVSPLSYRIFSRYIKPDINILPMEVCINIVEPILNPSQYQPFYRDKNSFDRILSDDMMAKTPLRRILGFYYDQNYSPIELTQEKINDLLSGYDKVLYKPATNDSGKGIVLFERRDNVFVSKNGDKLDVEYLTSKTRFNYLIQGYINQSLFTKQFNASSVNSFRVMTYRSVKTGEIKVPNVFFKIGGKGACVDNCHSGGVMCGVKEDGSLLNYVFDYLGNKFDSHLGINYRDNNYIVPEYEKLIHFSKDVAGQVIHHHLLSLDIAMDENNKPILIEINAQAFAGWAFQMSTGSIFKEYTDEVMEYCSSRAKSLQLTTSFQ